MRSKFKKLTGLRDQLKTITQSPIFKKAFLLFFAVVLGATTIYSAKHGWFQRVKPAQAAASFGAPVSYSVGGSPPNEPASVYVSDFNKDGSPDLAVANQFSNKVS